MNAALCALLLSAVIMPALLTGEVEPDRCLMDPDRVEVLGPRYLPNGADILNICDDTDWMGHGQHRALDLPESVREAPDLWPYCTEHHGPQDGFHAPLGVKGCIADHVVAVWWVPYVEEGGISRPLHGPEWRPS